MGEIADAMISGDLCVGCGSVLECEGFGIPIMCHDCHSKYKKKCNQPVCRPLNINEQELVDYIAERLYPKNKALRATKAAMMHNLTCGDLSHGHGIAKVKWDKRKSKQLKLKSKGEASG